MGTEEEGRLQRHARIAGFLFLFYIVAFALGATLAARYAPVGGFQGPAGPMAASSIGFRSGLLLQLMAGMTAFPLGFSLYVLLRPIDRDWALAAFMWRVGEGVLNATFVFFKFLAADMAAASAHQSAAAQGDRAIQLLATAPSTMFPIAVIFFSIGSIVFFWLLIRSRFIPLLLAWIGVLGSFLAAALGVLSLLLPTTPGWLPFLWGPLAAAEIVGGLVLLIRGADLRHWRSNRSPGAADV
jgi:hypothetical protein